MTVAAIQSYLGHVVAVTELNGLLGGKAATLHIVGVSVGPERGDADQHAQQQSHDENPQPLVHPRGKYLYRPVHPPMLVTRYHRSPEAWIPVPQDRS